MTKNRIQERRFQADDRNARRGARTPDEQIKLLDKRLGKGKGAKRERARLK